jgi:ribosomal protein L17
LVARKQKKMKQKTNKSYANPYKDGLEAKERARKAETILSENFGKIERMGAKQIFFIKNRGKSFYIQITSAPSNPKLNEAIKGVSKQFGKLPYYIVFTRDTDEYPDASVKTYWNKLKGLRKKLGPKFLGAIISLDELETTIPKMKKLTKLTQNIITFSTKTGNRLELDVMLKEGVDKGLTPKQVNQILEIIKYSK